MKGASQGPAPRPDLDQIRTQLRELGYLKGSLSRLEGWMVAGRGGPSSFVRLNAAAAVRVGAVGGPLLGIPAAAAVALANRPHIVAPRDLLLLALYFSLALGLALGLMEFLTDLILAWIARRGLVLVGRMERVAARSGLLFTAATTLYLAWLLRSGRRATGEGLGAWIGWTGAIVATLAVGHFIGRLTKVGSLLALAAGAGGLSAGEGSPRARGARRLRPPLGLSLLAVAAGLLIFAPPDLLERSASAPSSFTPEPMQGRLVVLGIDGLDSGWLDRMESLACCPTLTRLEREGARYDLRAEDSSIPPATWTTIATGRPRQEHGILGYEADRVPGLTSPVQRDPSSRFTPTLRMLLPPLRPPPTPVSSGLRRAPAVWEILARGGVETAAINWWATWPTGSDDGIVVSERAYPRLSARLLPDRDVAPASLQAALAERFERDLREASPPAGRGEAISEQEEGIVTTSITLDGYHALVARRLFEAGMARVCLLYLPGLDIARTRMRAGGAGQAAPTARPRVLAEVLARVDAVAGSFVSMMKPEDLILIVGDPGRAPASPERARGILLIWGARAIPGRMGREPSLLDITPTLLALSGFPMARDMPGSPVLDFLRAGDRSARLEVPIDSYGWRPEPVTDPAVDPFDKEVLDRLRGLGYIQ
ncbi:MAG TPA: alkaline phosphatase family protein [Candidatus Polarisedimenticolia bacterium]